MLINQYSPDKIVSVAEMNKRKQFLNGFRKIPGVKWWQLTLEDGEITEVVFDKINAGYKAGVQYRIDIKKNTLYVPAVNKKNAERKFRPMIEELIGTGNVLQLLNIETNVSLRR